MISYHWPPEHVFRPRILILNMNDQPSTSIGTFRGREICCGTPEGAAYVKKVTHPPTTIPNEYQGIPDCSAPNVVTMEVKGEQNVAPILTYPNTSTTAATVNPSSMLFLGPSGGRVGAYVFLQLPTAAGLSWVQPVSFPAVSPSPAIANTTSPAVLNAGYNFGNWSQDVAVSRTSYKSETFYLNATDFNNQGQVTTAKFKPNIITGLTLLSLLAEHANQSQTLTSLRRAVGQALKRTGRPTQVDDEGYEVISAVNSVPAADYAVQVWQVEATSTSSAITQLFGTPMYALTGILPTSSSDVLVTSSKAATRPAREGAFVVHQPAGPVNDWQPSPTGIVQLTKPLNQGPVVCLLRSVISGVVTYAPLYSDPNVTNTGLTVDNNNLTDSPWNNLDWEMTLFEGLTVPTSTGTTLSSVPYVTVKTFTGIELQTQPVSSLQPFARLLPLPDPDALLMATGIFHARPDSLPASANDLGSILGTAVKFIPTAINWLSDAFGSKKTESKVEKSNDRMDHRVAQLTDMVQSLATQVRASRAPTENLPSFINEPERQPRVRNKARAPPKPRAKPRRKAPK